MTVVSALDAAGRRRSPATMPGYHAGRPPRNKGIRYPADPPTVDEIVAGAGVPLTDARALALSRKGARSNMRPIVRVLALRTMSLTGGASLDRSLGSEAGVAFVVSGRSCRWK